MGVDGEEVSYDGEVTWYICDGAPQEIWVANITNNAETVAQATCVWIQEPVSVTLPIKVKPETIVCHPNQNFGIFLILTEVDEAIIGNFHGSIQLTITNTDDVYTLPFYTKIEILKEHPQNSNPFNYTWLVFTIAAVTAATSTVLLFKNRRNKTKKVLGSNSSVT